MPRRFFFNAAATAALALSAAGATAPAAQIPVASYFHETSPYAYVDSGNELTDGVWNPNGISPADPWVGWSSAHSRTVFDLGSPQPVRAASIVFCHWSAAAVYLPTSVAFQFSNDPGFAARTTLTFLTDGLTVGAATVQRDYDLSAAPDARYVRLSADHSGEWLFIGEVQFSSVPEPATAALCAVAPLSLVRRRARR